MGDLNLAQIMGDENCYITPLSGHMLKNFENIRLVGTNGNDGSNGSYEIKLTNELIANNHDENGLLNIINDNDLLINDIECW